MLGFRAIVSVAAGALAVTGCAPLNQEQPAGPYFRPMQTVRHGADLEALYRTGRYFQGQIRYGQAIDAYRQVLAANPNHADAHNALGVIYSLQNRAELAEREFRAALEIAPDAARVHNNLGYHLMMNGRLEEALASFGRARALAPRNAMVAANLVAAREKLGLPSDAQGPASPAARAVAQQDASSRVPAPEATMRLDRLSESVWELRTTPVAEPATAPAGSALAAAIAQNRIEVYPRSVVAASTPALVWNRNPAAYPIEIANGNGATGLARLVSNLLAPRGIQRPRLTNNKPYGVVTSRIQYVAGAEQVAREINSSLPVQLPLARVPGLERNVRVRVLLGKDFPRNAVPAEAGAQSPIKLAAVGPSNEQ